MTQPDLPTYDVEVPESTPEFTAVRYEPLAPPILMLQAAPVEGESVERLVIRTRPSAGSEQRPRATWLRRKRPN